MGEEEDRNSDFAERVRKWELENPDEAKRLVLRQEFHAIISDFLNKNGLLFRGSHGTTQDELGGDLFYVYIRPSIENPIKIGRGFVKKDVPEVGKVLPEALEEYFRGISEAMKEALKTLLQEVLQSSLGHFRPMRRYGFGFSRGYAPFGRYFDDVQIEYDSSKGKSEITRFPKQRGGHKKSKLSEVEREALRAQYKQLLPKCRDIKRSHDKQQVIYENSPSIRRNGFKRREWAKEWVSYAGFYLERGDLTEESLARFADQSKPSAKNIALAQLASEVGLKASYIDKLVSSRKPSKTPRTRRTQHKKTDI